MLDAFPSMDTLSSRFLPRNSLQIGDNTHLLALFTVHVVYL
jgi:hypothetical protein